MEFSDEEKLKQLKWIVKIFSESKMGYNENLRINFCTSWQYGNGGCKACAFHVPDFDGTYGECRLRMISRARAFAKENGIDFPEQSEEEARDICIHLGPFYDPNKHNTVRWFKRVWNKIKQALKYERKTI